MKLLLAALIGLLTIAGVLLLVSFVGLCWAAILWLAWKYIAVATFGAPALSFLQCFGATFAIGVLAKLIRSK